MMTAFPFWCERSLQTLDKITIKHLICYIAFHPACVQLCDLWHSLCVGSVISIWSGCAWRFISVHGSELIWCVFVCMMKPYRDSLASLLSICLLWQYKTWIQFAAAWIRRNTNTKSQAKIWIGWKNHSRALKGGFDHCFLQCGVSEDSLHLPEILITWFHFYYHLLMFSYKTAYISV